MKFITRILLIILLLVGALIFVTVSDRDGVQAPTTSPPPVAAVDPEPPEQKPLDELYPAAREACGRFLLQTLDQPDAAEFQGQDDWDAGTRPEGTIGVVLEARMKDALGEMIAASWECVVLPSAGDMRLVTLKLIEAEE